MAEIFPIFPRKNTERGNRKLTINILVKIHQWSVYLFSCFFFCNNGLFLFPPFFSLYIYPLFFFISTRFPTKSIFYLKKYSTQNTRVIIEISIFITRGKHAYQAEIIRVKDKKKQCFQHVFPDKWKKTLSKNKRVMKCLVRKRGKDNIEWQS